MMLLVLALAGSSWAKEPGLILHHGKVFVAPGHFEQAVAIEDGRILEVGTDEKVLALKGKKTRVVDLAGRSVVPGFHDAHVHFLEGGESLGQLKLNGTTSVAEIQKKLAEYAKAHPGRSWILGLGWDHTAFADGKYPTRADLDAVVADRPVKLEHADGHMSWLNGAALKEAGISKATPDPVNGSLPRDASGEPTGILLESARQLVNRKLPKPSDNDRLAALQGALDLAAQSGVTSVQGLLDPSAADELKAWRRLYRKRKADIRYFAWGRLNDVGAAAKLRQDFSDLPADRFRLVALKGFVDGVISARTAALLEVYSDDPKTSGKPNFGGDELQGLVKKAHRAGFQSVLHAVGDRAVRMALDACAAAGGWKGTLPACKIEHIEVVSTEDIPRFKALGAVASMQPSHMTYDLESQNYNPERLGPRVERAFAWKSIQNTGAILAFGTDWPVMPLDPRIELFAATTRAHFNGKPEGGWIPEQKLSLEDALVHYTLDPARAVGLERELGSIEPGKRADLVVFGGDLFSTAGLALLKIPVDMTVFDGRIIFERR